METLTQELAEYLSQPQRPGTTWEEQLGEYLGPGALREWMVAPPADDACWLVALYPTGWRLTRLECDESDAFGVTDTVLGDELTAEEVLLLAGAFVADW